MTVTVLFCLEGLDPEDGSTVMASTVETVEDFPVAPRAGDLVRVFGQLCEVYRVEWGRRHDKVWGAMAYVRAVQQGGTDA